MIALAAMLAGRSDQLGIVRWGRKLSREALAELGIFRGRVPAPSVWSELFRALDVGALERLLGTWVKGAGAAGHVAIDGKRLRGSAVGDAPGVHLLAAFSERLQGVIGQLRVAPEANEAVWRTQPDSVWILFRFPGLQVLSLLFALTQVPMMMKDMKALEAAAEMEP